MFGVAATTVVASGTVVVDEAVVDVVVVVLLTRMAAGVGVDVQATTARGIKNNIRRTVSPYPPLGAHGAAARTEDREQDNDCDDDNEQVESFSQEQCCPHQ